MLLGLDLYNLLYCLNEFLLFPNIIRISLTLEYFTFSSSKRFTVLSNWRESGASKTLSGVTQFENRGCLFVYIYVWTYVCHFVL